MAKPFPQPSKSLVITSLVATGPGIGWLIGLAVSPVVSIVITSVTGAAATLVAVLSGLEDESNDGGQSGVRTSKVLLRQTAERAKSDSDYHRHLPHQPG